jgi:hypothetical protein
MVWAGPSQAFRTHRYPADIGSPPHEKQMLFEVKKARHLGRRGFVGEDAQGDWTVAAAALYMPADALSSKTTVDWTGQDIGMVGGAIIEAFSAGGAPTTDNIMQKLAKVGGAGAGGMALDLAAKNIILPLINAVSGGGNGKAILQSMFGQQTDPRTDMLFNAVQYRRHTFSFTLIPRSVDEAQSINNILNVFQFYMLPKYGGVDGLGVDSFFIGYPYEFDITMITAAGAATGGLVDRAAGSPHINKIDRSVLTECDINHASGSRVAFMGNYYPASTSLTLNFTEVRLQGRDSYGGPDGVMWHGSDETPLDPNSVITTKEGIELVKTVVAGAGELASTAVGAITGR